MTQRKIWISWIAASIAALIYVQSLFFKFSASPESVYIFQTIADWSGLSLFEPFGRLMVGASELVASILILLPRTRFFGALMSVGVIGGALFFHLFSPLGIEVQGDGGTLFYMAVAVFVLSLFLVFLHAGRKG